MKTKTHSFVVTIRTDRECTRATALRELRDTIHGEHYCSALEDGDPEAFTIKSFRPLTPAQRRATPRA